MTSKGQKPRIMGILNVTPDSFSDGGEYIDPTLAIARFEQLLDDGADFVDIGAESTRPGADDVSDEEEWMRLAPLLEYAQRSGRSSRLSLDTRKYPIMGRAVDMGVGTINNVGELPSRQQLKELFRSNPDLMFIACHMHGTPKTMQENPIGSRSALKRVKSYFEAAVDDLRNAGCRPEYIFLDPGIGFGKSDSANINLILAYPELSQDYQTVLGVSRKGFISRLFDSNDINSRDLASKVIETCAAAIGVKIIRTHNVKKLKHSLDILSKAAQEVAHG